MFMAKKNQLSEAEVLARMAGNFRETIGSEKPDENFKKEEKVNNENDEQRLFVSRGKETYGNGKRSNYEEKFLNRTIYGVNRSNVGISKETLNIAEKVIARIFDNKIAIGTYIDNILWEHFNRYKKEYEAWLVEKPNVIF
jgi:hypothetical protein